MGYCSCCSISDVLVFDVNPFAGCIIFLCPLYLDGTADGVSAPINGSTDNGESKHLKHFFFWHLIFYVGCLKILNQ